MIKHLKTLNFYVFDESRMLPVLKYACVVWCPNKQREINFFQNTFKETRLISSLMLQTVILRREKS